MVDFSFIVGSTRLKHSDTLHSSPVSQQTRSHE